MTSATDLTPTAPTVGDEATPGAAPARTAYVHRPDAPDRPWWRDAVIYQVYPRSWADGDGDGIGDLPGVTARLPYLRDLGVDAIWLSPFYRSPMHDAGYDVADYRDVDPVFGTLADADQLIAGAHDLGLKVLLDLVPNHSSSEHAWFQAALAAAPGSPERARYMFRDGTGPGGDAPPNNWTSVFGGPGWTRVTEADGRPGQWYLHLFDETQPDYDWSNPEVVEEFHAILRFWLDRGVDGFRVDVAHGLVKQEGLPDWDAPLHLLGSGVEEPDDRRRPDSAPVHDEQPPMWDQPGVHEVYRAWRKILDGYSPERILCAEAWVEPVSEVALYTRPDEMHQAFNFAFLETPWDARRLRTVIEDSYAACDSVGAPTTWVLSNHDVVRHASRLGLDQGAPRPNGIGAHDPQPDAALGLRRARAATALMLALPGGAYLYQGEELGLPEHTSLPDEVRQDPTFVKSEFLGRDGCRIPMPWSGEEPSLGFGPSQHTWLPQPDSYAALAVDRQDGEPTSTLELYRLLLRLRRERGLGIGGLRWHELSSEAVVALVNVSTDGQQTLVVTNVGGEAVELPRGAEVIAASGPVDGIVVPTDTTVWALV